MAITFDHAVKYKGRFYPPNTPIEDAPEAPQEAENPPQDAPEAPSEEIIEEPAQPARKAAKTRKKGDA